MACILVALLARPRARLNARLWDLDLSEREVKYYQTLIPGAGVFSILFGLFVMFLLPTLI